ncbi:KEOPS complex component [Halobacteriales archaeon QS_4_69_34]|nr:MAG: KEOPS complex component [Halobacteriales archaeon QS_4_69_34]
MELVGGRVTIGGEGDDTGSGDDRGEAKSESAADRTDGSAANRVAFENVEAFVERLDEVGTAHGCTVQAFDARYVVGQVHLERAVALADRARERGEAVARERAVEVLLYAAGRRQIDRALEMGVGAGENRVVVLVDAEPDAHDADERATAAATEALIEPAETLGEYDEHRVQAFFDITDAEVAATDAGLGALVAERVALLDIEK